MTWKVRGEIQPQFYTWQSYLPLEFSSETYRFTFSEVDYDRLSSFCWFRRRWCPDNQPEMVERAQRLYVKGNALIVHIPIIPLFETIWNSRPAIEIVKVKNKKWSYTHSDYKVKLEYYV